MVRGEARLIVPLLVTGCKVWHLREEGVFYPKLAWQIATAMLPDNAQVICPSHVWTFVTVVMLMSH
jgi:hypothetical protein